MGSYTELPTENSVLFLQITEKQETLHEGSRCIVLKPSVGWPGKQFNVQLIWHEFEAVFFIKRLL
jgi:hypothetical protein